MTTTSPQNRSPTESSPILDPKWKQKQQSPNSPGGTIHLSIGTEEDDQESISPLPQWAATLWSSWSRTGRLFISLLGIALIASAIVLILNITSGGGGGEQDVTPVEGRKGSQLLQLGTEGGYGLVLQTPQGKLKWNLLESREGRKYYAFYKIPYAKPPIGDLRFEPTQALTEKDGWGDEIRFEKEVAPQCIQKVKYSPIIEAAGEEDCLYANIYTPKLPGAELEEGKLMPTLFYIHGGGFADGNGSRYGGKYFMDEDVVLITFQYRIGAFGFLSAENKLLQGNMGMKDQVMALKWVRDNIQYFGGDPKRVMIFGNSAGAMSVNEIMASPLAKGLYHRAITQSGPSLGSTTMLHEEQLKSFESLVRAVGCDSSSENEKRRTKRILRCLRDLPAKDLAVIRSPDISFGMTIERHDGEEAEKFLPDSIYNTLISGNGNPVPWIIGVNSDEWIGSAATDLKDPVFMEGLQSNWSGTMQSVFIEPLDCNPSSGDEIMSKARSFYFGDKAVSNATLKEFSNLLSDRDVIHPSFVHGMIQSEFSDVYFYVLNKRPAKSYSDSRLTGYPPGDYGTSHADELQYLFNYNGYPEYPIGSEHFSFSRYLVKTWVHFAATGTNPPEWESYKLGQTPISMFALTDEPKLTTVFQSRIEFWNQFTPQDLCYV